MSVNHKKPQSEASTPVSGDARFVAARGYGVRVTAVLLGSLLLGWAAFIPADNLAAATHPARKTTSSIRLSRPTFGSPVVPAPQTQTQAVRRQHSASTGIQIIPGHGSHRHIPPSNDIRANSRRMVRQGAVNDNTAASRSHNAFKLATQTDAPAANDHSQPQTAQPSSRSTVNSVDRSSSNDAGKGHPLSVYPPHQQAKAGVKAPLPQTESLAKPDDFSVLPEAPTEAVSEEAKVDSSDQANVSTLEPTLEEATSNRQEEVVAPEPERAVDAEPLLTLPQEPSSTSPDSLSAPRSDADANPFVIPGAIFDAPAVPETMSPESVEEIGGRPNSPVPEIPSSVQLSPEVVVEAPHAGHSIHAVETPISGHVMNRQRPGTSGSRANTECDADVWMAPYTSRAGVAGAGTMPNVIGPLSDLPPDYSPWWDAVVRQPSGIANTTLPVDVSMLLQDAMLYSPQVTAIKTEPEVQYRVITQEAAKFDWTAFLEATYDDLNDPAGNNLATGNGEDRLLTRKVRGSGGLRQKNLYGGEFRIAQELGHENQNSRIFIPNNQGTSRLELSYRQPLWDGAGRSYNESEIILARIQANSSEDEVVDALQDHLIEVTEAYWTLYRSRSEFFQRRKLLTSAQQVLARLEGRSQVDTIPRQVLRSRAAVARAQTRIQRTVARVKDAEAQLRLLVNSPGMLNGGPTELMPTEPPTMVTENADLQCVLQTALINRSDISEAIRKMRASSVRLGVSKNELLPRLDFLIETYVADLSGNSDVARSLKGQYVNNRPGFTIGLEFEVPLGNRAANAKLEQRQWELKRSVNVFRATVEKSLTDVEISNREVATAYSEMISRFASMTAAENESNYLQDRFEVLPASEDSATLLLEDLLDSFERLADEESSFVQAQVDHAVALVKLKKELGILLQSRHSRPNVDPAHQAWVNDRIQSAVGHTKRTNVKPVSFPQVSQQNVVDPSSYYRAQPGTAAATRPASGIGGYLNP